MNIADMIQNVKVMVQPEEVSDAVCATYLEKAANTILGLLYRAYGSVPEGATVPMIHQFDQIELASRYILRRGGEGEMAHSENGVSRTYGSVDDQDILRRIMPYARVM